MSRPYYRYDVRHFKIEKGGYHQCTGNVVAVLSASYSEARETWYITVMCKQIELREGLSPGEEFFVDEDLVRRVTE